MEHRLQLPEVCTTYRCVIHCQLSSNFSPRVSNPAPIDDGLCERGEVRKQLAAKRSRELSYGSLLDLEQVYAGQPEAEQRVYASELFAHLSP